MSDTRSPATGQTPLTEAELSRLHAAFESIAFVRLLGLKLGEVVRGAATLHVAAHDQLSRHEGITHGGAIASLADTAAAFAVLTLLEPGQSTATVDFTIHYLRPVATGDHLSAHARVLRAGRRLLTIAVDVKNHQDEITATILTTYTKFG